MIADTFESLNNAFSFLVVGTANIVGVVLIITALVCLVRKASEPEGSSISLGSIAGFFLCGVLFLNTSTISDVMGKSLFGEDTASESYVQAYTPPETKTIVSAAPVKQYKPLIPKTEYKPIPAKEVDYTQLIVVTSSIVGAGVGLFLSIIGISKLRTKLRLRKYQKVVSNVVELNNDFMTLSEHINTIDTCLDDIKTYRVTAPVKTKSLLDSMQNILESKKNMFNKAVREIHEMQPELKEIGGSI